MTCRKFNNKFQKKSMKKRDKKYFKYILYCVLQVPQQSPLEGRLQMHVSCEPSITVEYHNFLTIFEYVSGFGIWQRRWCLLKGTTLSYYKYPYHEGKKTPLGSLDLRGNYYLLHIYIFFL